MHWDCTAYKNKVVQCIGIALLISIVVQCIGIAMLMISIVVQCIGVKLLMIKIVVQCNRLLWIALLMRNRGEKEWREGKGGSRGNRRKNACNTCCIARCGGRRSPFA